MSIVGFALAGGDSLRMGRDKALIPWQGPDLLGHTLARLSAVTAEVHILCGREPRYLDRGVPVDRDPPDAAGPLAGVLAGLSAAAGGTGLFLAVDLPLVPVALLARLVELREGFDAVVPRSARGPEPLCAVYAATCLEPVRRCLAAGELKMTSVWPAVRVRELPPAELALPVRSAMAFLNVNGPDDLRAAEDAVPR